MLCSRVKNIWGLQGEFNAIDLGTDYFLFKFSDQIDCTKVFTGGPWVIMDHYLTVRCWEPNFKPSEAFETTTAVWVRFLELSIEYYQEKVLYAIAKAIGKPLKIDWNTAMVTRRKFARVCVEMDLSKPLKPKFMLEGMVYSIEYESLHSFCFLCGRIDHQKEACRFKTPSAPSMVDNLAILVTGKSDPQHAIDNSHLHQQCEKDEIFGPWMLVTKRNKRIAQHKRAQEPTSTITNTNSFRYLEVGQDSHGNIHKEKKNSQHVGEKAQGESSSLTGPAPTTDPKGKNKLGLQHYRAKESNTHSKHQPVWQKSGKSLDSHTKDLHIKNLSHDQVKVTTHISANQL
ncbi:uncharacterized protein LOC114279793 [Camellia sinensis]|uniref:uncharacterized protein LOC114279793 n=1 Tax=Camellia sinensis TaxID=4442 RepID=UPI00103645B0|nr:uncharacterized protein LOC114279793 [Camellia sinensis]